MHSAVTGCRWRFPIRGMHQDNPEHALEHARLWSLCVFQHTHRNMCCCSGFACSRICSGTCTAVAPWRVPRYALEPALLCWLCTFQNMPWNMCCCGGFACSKICSGTCAAVIALHFTLGVHLPGTGPRGVRDGMDCKHERASCVM